jgi:beta-ureidopropionase / N-carbamoyl-L-amino-acid hydrolase
MKIRTLVVLLILSSLISLAQKQDKKDLIRTNPARIEQRILELASFGKNANGHTQRVAFTPADTEGRNYFMKQMKGAGLDVTIDFAGNIIGKRKGKDASKKPIVFGSHIDTVPSGGNYDGCVGSIGALEVITVLNENNIITNHPLEMIIFANEEGGVVGSSALAGTLEESALKQMTLSGLTMGEGIRAIGGNPDRLKEVKRNAGDIKAFLELHIEQGGTLDKEKIQIGVVEGIVGINWWDVTVEGFANHAGTTPMNMRQDALLAAAKVVIAVNEVVNSMEGAHVGTVGKIAAEPGAPNVIPGKVVMSLELRDLSYEKIMQLYRAIEQRAAAIAEASAVKISFKPLSTSSKPAMANAGIQQKIITAAAQLGLSYKRLPSGAGHDAQEMALLAPMGMIFIPSKGGISHSPKEFSTATDMANGANVLLHAILLLDKE